jgi:hypothetical protein
VLWEVVSLTAVILLFFYLTTILLKINTLMEEMKDYED